jgi:hypothetical protein
MLSRPRTSAAMQSTAIERRANLPGRVSLHGEVCGLFHSNPSSSSKHIVVIAALINALRTMRRSLRRAHWSSSFDAFMASSFDQAVRVQACVQASHFSIETHMPTQYELPLMAVINGPKPVPAEVVSGWTSVHDAVAWSFENRTHPEGKPLTWLAHHLKKRRPHLSRLIHRQDLKLDAIESHIWDCLVGWTAISQYVEAEKARMNQAAAETINNALKVRFAA